MISRDAHLSTSVRALALATLSVAARKSRIPLMLAAFWLCAPGSLPAQTFTTVFSFDGAEPLLKIVPSGNCVVP
jgi:hypothetical protein